MSGPSSLGWLATVAEAVKVLSRHRIEALLIVGESKTGRVDGGIVIEGRVSDALLVTLFTPDSLNALRTGAVLVRRGVVERAGIPVLRSAGWEWIGQLAQEVGAVVISVSEEDGLVRVAGQQGDVVCVQADGLARHLADALVGDGEK